MVSRGHSWSLVVTRGHSWSLVVTRGHSWSLVVTRGHSWSLVVTRGHSWSLVVSRGHSWSLVVTRGHSWSLVVTRGHSWSLVVTRSHSWSLVSTFRLYPAQNSNKPAEVLHLKRESDEKLVHLQVLQILHILCFTDVNSETETYFFLVKFLKSTSVYMNQKRQVFEFLIQGRYES